MDNFLNWTWVEFLRFLLPIFAICSGLYAAFLSYRALKRAQHEAIKVQFQALDLQKQVARQVEDIELLKRLSEEQQIVLLKELEGSRAALKEASRKLDEKLTLNSVKRTAEPALYLAELEVSNIRCIEHLTISFLDDDGKPRRHTLLLGDNSSGKSTLLRCIALAMCNEADAAALIPAWSGNVIRHGAESATIRIALVNEHGTGRHEIVKTILCGPDGSEIVRQETTPRTDFKWESMFLCAYGTQRTATATRSFDSYSTLHAVSTLFDEGKSLQNPELIMLRQPHELRERLAAKLASVMLLDPSQASFISDSSQLQLKGPWGTSAFPALSDGFRSTSQWLLDLLAWSLYAGRVDTAYEPDGIVIIDELEQHLHPRWQRYIVQRISQQFPNIQFVATTHTPLVASGAVDVASSLLLRLSANGESIEEIDPEDIRGHRADQVLAEVFGLPTTRNPGSASDMNRWNELRAMSSLSEAEQRELREVELRLDSTLSVGETPLERTVEGAVSKALDDILDSPPPKALSLEVKRQLRELLGTDGEKSS